MQQLGVCLDEERKRQQAGPMLRRFIAVYLARLPPDASGAEGTLQALWDLAFLERLSHMWGEDTSEMSERITAGIRTDSLWLRSGGEAHNAACFTRVEERRYALNKAPPRQHAARLVRAGNSYM